MSKFKVGDKVRVKYIPGVTDYGRGATFHQYLDLQGEKEIQWISPSGFTFKLKDDPDDFWFCEESLELLNTSGNTQRTLLGLETEADLLEKEAAQLWKKIWSLRDEIQKLKEDIDLGTIYSDNENIYAD